jgi:hypothetical protein
MNLGKPIFLLFAFLAFLSALWRGLPPIGFIEIFLWASLAWLWTKKDWKDARLNYALLAIAALILLGEGYRVGVVAGQQQTAKASLNDRDYKLNANPLDALRSETIDKCGPANTNLIDRAMDHCDDAPKLAPEKKPESTNNPSSFEDSVAASEKEQISAIATGSYSGTVHNKTADKYATFNVQMIASNDTIKGCMQVALPLFGTGPIAGNQNGDDFQFDLNGRFVQIHFDGTRVGHTIKGKYVVTGNPNGQEIGDFSLHQDSVRVTLPHNSDLDHCPRG